MEPQTVKAHLDQSRSYSDRAMYSNARDSLEKALSSLTGIDRLEIAAEYASVFQAQGYFPQALEILEDEDERLTENSAAAPEAKWPIIRLKMEICLLRMTVTAEFDQYLQDAEDLHVQADGFAAIMELDPSAIDAAVYYAKMRLLSCQYHDPVKLEEPQGLVSWLMPAFEKLTSLGRFREAYKILEAYGIFFRQSKHVGTPGLDFHTWHTMVETLITSADLPLLRANAMLQLSKYADESIDQTMITEMESNAARIYAEEEHQLGVADVRVQQISREMQKGPENITEKILLELKKLFSKYESFHAVASYYQAVETIIPHTQGSVAPDLRLQLYQISDELQHCPGTTLATYFGRIRLINESIAHKDKAEDAAEDAVRVHTVMGAGGCRWLRGMAAYLASLAYCQVMDFQTAADWATKSVEQFDGRFIPDLSKATTTLVQAKLGVGREKSGSGRVEGLSSFAENAINDDLEQGSLDQAALKMELISGNIQELSDEKIKDWVESMESIIKNLATTDSDEADVRMAGLYQRYGSIVVANITQDSDAERWDQAMEYYEKAVALYTKHKKLMEAANTRQIQSVVLYHRFELSPSAALLSPCLETLENSLALFTTLDMLTFVSSVTECRSRFMYGAWEHGWVTGTDVLAALEKTEVARARERADATGSPSLEALSRPQLYTYASIGNALGNIYEQAFNICLKEGRIKELWSWTQRAKARSVSDQLALGGQIPLEIKEQINQDEAKKELTRKAEEIWKQIPESDPMTRLGLRGELDRLESQMREDPLLKLALDIKNGTPVELDQMIDLGVKMKKRSDKQNVLFIDWVEHGGKFWLLILDSESGSTTHTRCNVSVDEVVTWKRIWLDHGAGRYSAFADDDYYSENEPEFSLRMLDDLVCQLGGIAKSEDILIFCPTGVLHSIPLHALWVERKVPVLQRHPVIYAASLTTFWQCQRRVALASERSPSTSMPWTATGVFEPGPSQFTAAEQDKVYSFITWIAEKFKTRRGLGEEVNSRFLKRFMQQSSLFHFHGHCVLDPKSLDDQCLFLASDKVTLRDMLQMKLNVPHITMVACDSESQAVARGDEPLKSVTALLCAGAGSVMGTMWPTASKTGRYFCKEFYSVLAQETKSNEGGVVDLAHITRKAVLALRENSDTGTPYHWATFVLHGSPVFKGRHKRAF